MNMTEQEQELERKIEQAASRGVRKALAEVGLDDDMAREDIRDLRSLIAAWRDTKSTVWQAVLRYFTTFLLGAMTLGAFWKFKGGP